MDKLEKFREHIEQGMFRNTDGIEYPNDCFGNFDM